mmetsp:Transcript_21402/g.69261  ORF Transcript_21402/g.69261 Transcript_21402/m.69261 type:complete len:118 (+) Transcript_21402:930-1283(+)
MGGPSARTASPNPPEKGVFPLDHFAECKAAMQEYLGCMRAATFEAGACRHLSKAYLQCRMDRGLMAAEEFGKLGYAEEGSPAPAPAPVPAPRTPSSVGTSDEPFLAGLKRSGGPRAA